MLISCVPMDAFPPVLTFLGLQGGEGFSPNASASPERGNAMKTEHYLFSIKAPILKQSSFKTKKQMEELKENESYIWCLESTYWVIAGL